ncbi:MAG TPA: gamma carbonic anhydrase family protein [Polyangiaceae bacterium]|jgi:carbonic anhydrase/acetyltransferase-like protein (isoleucine patch superfamily)
MADIVRAFRGVHPKLGSGVYLADTARVIGDVEIGDDASIWFGSVLRGDVGSIRVGARSNIQDLSMLHMSLGISSTIIGEEVTVGHGVIIHGAVIGDGALIGMGAILLDNCEIGAEALIAAGTVVTAGTKIPPRSLVLGQPGKVVRVLDASEAQQGRMLALRYVEVARAHRESAG